MREHPTNLSGRSLIWGMSTRSEVYRKLHSVGSSVRRREDEPLGGKTTTKELGTPPDRRNGPQSTGGSQSDQSGVGQWRRNKVRSKTTGALADMKKDSRIFQESGCIERGDV